MSSIGDSSNSATTVVDDLLADLDAAIELLAGVDPVSCSDELLDRLVVSVCEREDRLSAASAGVKAQWRERELWRTRRQAPTSAAGLASATRRCEQTTGIELLEATKFTQLPDLHAAVLSGGLSLEYARLVLRVATAVRLKLAVRDQQLLIDALTQVTCFVDAAKVVAYWCRAADDELDIPPTPEHPSSLYTSRSATSGDGFVTGTLSPVDAEIVFRELDRIAEVIRRRHLANKITSTAAQRRAAALVVMATRSINATGPTARPALQIIVGDDTASHLCELASGHVIHPSHLVRWLGRATMEVFLFDGPTTVISKSRLRTFTGSLRKAIQVRDRHCQHAAGCSKPAIDCDIDHIIPWAAGGETSQFNGHSKCDSQNRREDLRDNPTPMPERDITRQDETDAITRWRQHHQRRNSSDPDGDCDG